jgi:hypothetical protein
MPIGEPMGVQAKVQLLDQGDKLITFGSIQLQLHDPNQTGTLFMYDGGVLEFLQQSVSRDDPEGTDLLGYLVAGANAEGEEFYLRVNRIGRDPTLDITYKGVKPTAVPGGQKRTPESQIAERRAKAANPVAKLEAFVLVNATVDADRLQNKLLVQATDAAGGYMENVFIDYRVIDENGTGSAFLLDGNPIGSSIGVTEGSEGFALAVDYLLTGKKPGTFTVRATAPENADPATVFADFRITISSLVPTSLRIVRRGSPSAPIGDLVPPDALIELLDQNGNPITFGSIQTQIYDPNDTGSLYWADGVVNYIQTSVQPGGTPLVGFLMPGEDNVGKEFYLRVNRIGREPHIDIPYTSVAPV